MTMTPKGLYIHVPFCRRKCNYCDFCSVSCEGVSDEYIDRLLAEARLYVRDGRIPIDTVYFGGGTPSLLKPSQLERIMSALADAFEIRTDSEITLECNPGTADREGLSAFHRLGVNRLSLGLQSIHENELIALGRIHDFSKFLDTYSTARAVGFDNISVDIMYGIAHQTVGSFEETLKTLLSLSPEHLSVYGLIVEEGTPFFAARDKLPLPDEDAECDMYYLADRLLREAGYLHYEISNYARAGFESRHNLKYWRDLEYIGLGVSAYSYFEGVRYGNTRSLGVYLSGGGIREDVNILTPFDKRYEYAMMRLRLAEGISLSEYERLFGVPFAEGKEEIISDYVSRGLMRIQDGRLSFTAEGFYISNSLLVNIL